MVKKRILVLANHEISVYNFRREIIEKFENEGFEIIISCPHGEKINLMTSQNVKHIPINLERHGKNIFTEIKLMKSYHTLIKVYKPDVIISFTIKPNIYGSIIAHITKTPIITNVTGLGNSVVGDGFINRVIKKLYSYCLSLSYLVFFQNKSNMDFMAKNHKLQKKSILLPGSGVNLSEFSPTPLQDNDLIVITYLGRIMRSKGIIDLVEAIQLLQTDKKVEFNLVGFFDDIDTKKIIESKIDNRNISILPPVDNVREILSKSTCVILPSHHEGMSNALLEAAAAGKPLLASDIPGCKEIVVDNYNGFVFNPHDPQDMCNSITKFVELSFLEKMEMGLNSRKHVENNFDRNIVVEAYFNEISKILNILGEKNEN